VGAEPEIRGGLDAVDRQLKQLLHGRRLAWAGFFAPGIGVGAFSDILLKDIKPTGNASLTWVKGNHTYKLGGELVVEGFPQQSMSRQMELIGFGASETANPWENGVTSFPFTSGIPLRQLLPGPNRQRAAFGDITDSGWGRTPSGCSSRTPGR